MKNFGFGELIGVVAGIIIAATLWFGSTYLIGKVLDNWR